jgi:predicted nucleic-acid-binding protein
VIALDTNLLVRYLVDDDPKLGARATELIASERCFVSRVVLLEVFQVLESVYDLGKPDLLRSVEAIFGLDNVTVEAHLATARAVSWYAQGMDFGDALVLAAADGRDYLATFDRDFARLSARLATQSVARDVRSATR